MGHQFLGKLNLACWGVEECNWFEMGGWYQFENLQKKKKRKRTVANSIWLRCLVKKKKQVVCYWSISIVPQENWHNTRYWIISISKWLLMRCYLNSSVQAACSVITYQVFLQLFLPVSLCRARFQGEYKVVKNRSVRIGEKI